MITDLRLWLEALWLDLRDRNLWPIAAGLVVLALAIPFLLGSSAKPEPAASAPVPDVPETRPAVAVTELEGVRVPDTRLKGRSAKNPFRQQLLSLPESAQIAGSAAGTSESSAPTAPVATPEEAAADAEQQQKEAIDDLAGKIADEVAPGEKPSDKGKTVTEVERKTIVKLVRFSADVKFGEPGERERINKQQTLAAIPGQRNPKVILIGFGPNGNKAGFEISNKVSSIWGEGRCVGRSGKRCTYMVLKPGDTAKLRFQPKGTDDEGNPAKPIVYHLSVVRINETAVSK